MAEDRVAALRREEAARAWLAAQDKAEREPSNDEAWIEAHRLYRVFKESRVAA